MVEEKVCICWMNAVIDLFREMGRHVRNDNIFDKRLKY